MAPPRLLAAFLLVSSSSQRVTAADWSLFDDHWKFNRGDSLPADCSFPLDMGSQQCNGLSRVPSADTTAACAAACCARSAQGCETWQFCPVGAKCAAGSFQGASIQGCWVGKVGGSCPDTKEGWVSKGRNTTKVSPTCTAPFCKKKFDDSSWKLVETPHDWAIEDLPSRDADREFPVLEVRNGSWLFSKSDEPSNANKSHDDSKWIQVTVPHDWRDPPTSVTGAGAVGWYRRHLAAASPAHMAAASAGTLKLGLGTVASNAEVFLNGVSIGSTGDLAKVSSGCEGYLLYRSFTVPSGVLASRGSNVVAVRVRSGDASQPGGLYDSMAPDKRDGPFDPASSIGQKQTGYTTGGVGWYRKEFSAPNPAPAGGRVKLRFDGVYMHADVFVNEAHLVSHPYGYTTFEVDVTDHLTTDASPNVLAIRVQSTGSNSRWYAGAGIYRHVHIAAIPAVHALTLGGVGVVAKQSDINLATGAATVTVTTAVHNAGKEAATATVTAHV